MRSMVEGLSWTPCQPHHHSLTRAVPLPVPGRSLFLRIVRAALRGGRILRQLARRGGSLHHRAEGTAGGCLVAARNVACA